MKGLQFITAAAAGAPFFSFSRSSVLRKSSADGVPHSISTLSSEAARARKPSAAKRSAVSGFVNKKKRYTPSARAACIRAEITAEESPASCHSASAATIFITLPARLAVAIILSSPSSATAVYSGEPSKTRPLLRKRASTALFS